jgi:hypothetical protein
LYQYEVFVDGPGRDGALDRQLAAMVQATMPVVEWQALLG